MAIKAPPLSYHVQGEEFNVHDLLATTRSARLPENLRPETVVIMAGGLGLRMMPLTRHVPKPLLPIGDAPVLEHIIAQMIMQGFHRFVFSLRHMSDQIISHFGNGDRWGISIRYIEEKEMLGTAGGLAYLSPLPDEPFVVANADLITDLDYRRVLERHRSSGALVSMCTREAEFQVPYGVVECAGNLIIRVEEKPVQTVTISAGMYVLSPRLISYISSGELIDMPDLIQRVIDLGEPVNPVPISDRWVDVGRRETYLKIVESLEAEDDPS